MEEPVESTRVEDDAREALEAQDPEAAAWYRRVRSGAKLAAWAAVVALVLAAASAVGMANWRVALQTGAGAGPALWGRSLVSILHEFVMKGVEPAAVMLLAAVVAMAAAKAAVAGRRPQWAPRLDARFARWASRLCTASFAAAFLVLVFHGFGMITSTPQMWKMFAGTTAGPGFSEIGFFASTLAERLILILKAFFTLLLGSYLIRALVMISVVEADAPPEAGDE